MAIGATFGHVDDLAQFLGMSTLLHDRYLVVSSGRARDLATGRTLRLDLLRAPETPSARPVCALVEAFEHAREAELQRHELVADSEAERTALVDAVADAARCCGFVPVAIEQYGEVAETDVLRHRAVVLIDATNQGPTATSCLSRAASVSSRPHALVTIRRPRSLGATVREARPRFGTAVVGGAPGPDVQRLLARATGASELVRRGRHAAAVRLLREVGAALERRHAWSAAADVALSLGWLLYERARMVDADRCGEHAAGLAARGKDTSGDAYARLLQAWARLELLKVVEAESIARAVLLTSPSEAVTACAAATLARSLLEQRRWRELQGLAVSAQVARDAGDRWFAMSHDVSVSMSIATRGVAEAGRMARQALDECTPAGDLVAHATLLTAHLRVVVTTGDPTLTTSALRQVLECTGRARAPFRALRARAIAYAVLRPHATSTGPEAQSVHARWWRVAPPAVTRDVECTSRPGDPDEGSDIDDAHLASTMLSRAQHDDDREAVVAVLSCAQQALDSCRIDVVSSDAGPAVVLTSIGSGPPSQVGARVLQSGISVWSEMPREFGVPLRLGTRLVGALVARWPTGRATRIDKGRVLECAAAVVAARVDGLQQRARDAAVASVEIPELIGVAAATTELRKAVVRAARAPFAVLIEGESGVGKELVARAIHHLSARRERRFCDVNCAALTDELLESELFGHAKGAFTGAVVERVGLFEEAHGGTLFLDEVADLSPRAQAKLLRAVQQQEIRRVGESSVRRVDVRFVAAANRSMEGEVTAGRFRADLLYRLDVVHLRVAPLRERPEDIAIIARHLWQRATERVGSTAVLAHETLLALTRYGWPGNVRELQNVIAALAVAAPPRGRVGPALLPPIVAMATGVCAGRLAPARDQFERRFIELALARANGNRSRAARALGLSRQGLLKSMGRLGMSPAPERTVLEGD